MRRGRPGPVYNWSQSDVSLARKPQLGLDRYFYRFVSWKGVDDRSDHKDPDVIVANRDEKWGATSVAGCKSHREYRSGSRGDEHDLRMRRQPCSCSRCRSKDYTSCPFHSWVAADVDIDDGWARNPIMLKARREECGASRSSRSAQRRVVQEALEQKQRRDLPPSRRQSTSATLSRSACVRASARPRVLTSTSAR